MLKSCFIVFEIALTMETKNNFTSEQKKHQIKRNNFVNHLVFASNRCEFCLFQKNKRLKEYKSATFRPPGHGHIWKLKLSFFVDVQSFGKPRRKPTEICLFRAIIDL